MSNALIHETSPYLLQHAHNPVNWYPWGEEALQKAITEDKPILVSIGYAACHWCHVMERESFEDEATAALMNEHFINIKIDREERPDLDHIYMDAVQAMAGSGGWPLNAFLTPDKKPFYGGTYFPPQAVMNRPSWKEVLVAVSDAFKNQRTDIEEQANGLTQHLFQANSFGISAGEQIINIDQIDAACDNLLKQADKQWGGFGAAPKFPQTFSIQFLLRYYTFENKRNPQLADDALKQALLSLDKMIEGGIYDQIGGGFARYSTDPEWLAPHFEKMLYDNALLITTLSEAYAITQNEYYKRTIEHTLTFIDRELTHPSNGFYAALDADSEGEEGKYYVWQLKEIQELLELMLLFIATIITYLLMAIGKKKYPTHTGTIAGVCSQPAIQN
ncbi:thioredoxin domain-containing protein [Niabella hibiscisoli]|uniref:thioredoxin domain-containing protein n=1 Tax=Niabella hibiscisoli TaxID=1825928 RepID=UPI001F114FE3|nr:thioredoxin domain-containing protein [Niabella hibiscisoli]MCH5714993.1 thioredoxin domain-containing protein [Niabella hibiscisoli]